MWLKQDGVEARWENPELEENPNFSIMEFLGEAGGSGNIFRQFIIYKKTFSSSERERKYIRNWSRADSLSEELKSDK